MFSRVKEEGGWLHAILGEMGRCGEMERFGHGEKKEMGMG
jgi:hypothetical protein